MLVLTASEKEVEAIESQLKRIIRPMWSNPPIHGARIVLEILRSPQLFKEWYACMYEVRMYIRMYVSV